MLTLIAYLTVSGLHHGDCCFPIWRVRFEITLLFSDVFSSVVNCFSSCLGFKQLDLDEDLVTGR